MLQILELFGWLAAGGMLAARVPAVLATLGGLYLVHLLQLWLEWHGARVRAGARPPAIYLVYLIPGVVLVRRLAEMVTANLFVRVYLVLSISLLLVSLPVTLLDRRDLVSFRVGRLFDRMDRGVEPVMDALVRAYNRVSLNPYPPGETGMVLAVPMPFRERIL